MAQFSEKAAAQEPNPGQTSKNVALDLSPSLMNQPMNNLLKAALTELTKPSLGSIRKALPLLVSVAAAATANGLERAFVRCSV